MKTSTMQLDAHRPLYSALRAVHFDELEKRSRAENLLDVVEMVAVAAGMKRAHLNGHGYRSERLLSELESIASAHGLSTMRTTPCLPYRHRASNVPSEVRAWEEEQEVVRQKTEPNVLWVYKDVDVVSEIEAVIRGEKGPEAVLGYPACCVKHHSEVAVRVGEMYFEALAKKFTTREPTAIVQLMRNDEEVDLVGTPPKMTGEESARRFPYVQFHACVGCLRGKSSPAHAINARMRELAFALDSAMGPWVWRAQYADLQLPAPALNSDCPCGSGSKLKRCCGVAL